MQKTVNTVMGWIRIQESRGRVIRLEFVNISNDEINQSGDDSPLLTEAFRQLEEYFRGERKNFDLPLELHGTDFQRRVWQELLKIPYGETVSYKNIAERVGNPYAARAVGMANHNNPIAIIVPCHRVIGADGRLGGYAGGVDFKVALLALERQSKEIKN